ncbi:MAG: hypothetical protein EXS13_10625 [Planctomycetes bacterium]|nr:hypothetical protein [Planctomycetota bacterium]
MTVVLQVIAVAVGTVALVLGSAPLLARGLRLDGLKAQLAAMAVRLFLAVLVALGLGLSRLEHRIALVFTVGAAYFAATLVDGVRHFRRRELKRELEG